jgi:hypothetical protein
MHGCVPLGCTPVCALPHTLHVKGHIDSQYVAARHTRRSYGVLGTATKLLSVGSNITSAITGTSSSAMGGAGGTVAGERVGNVGQGMVKGALTFGGGLLKGMTGIVADPVAGAKQGGVLGFMTGVGKGLVGVPGQIIGGALSAASQVTEGLDASVSKVGGPRGVLCVYSQLGCLLFLRACGVCQWTRTHPVMMSEA